MDIQAQDRAHRIGQTRPVLVFRLVTAHTIETRIMQRATEKRKLEALVIAKGTLSSVTTMAGRQAGERWDAPRRISRTWLQRCVGEAREGVLSDGI